MPTYRLLLEYDGSRFHGWQIQAGRPSVQETLERAIEVATGHATTVVGSGRTDAGVHARGQVAHFVVDEALDAFRLKASLNGILDGGVVVLAVEQAPDDFHARYDARRRRYHYYIATEPRVLDRHMRLYVRPAPDFERMNRAAQHLLGTHQFDAFCRARSETTNRVCTVHTAAWQPEDRTGDWTFVIEADRFLHGMVRSIVGTLLQIGHNQRDGEQLPEVLASRDRRRAGPAAPAHGLVLE
ncbi:MAG TPA: tRNA pseudouridine(38-40) synthase TruA, partial [Rhodothermales bacterium]